MASDPYLVDTGFFQHYDHPSQGRMMGIGHPVQFSKTPATWRSHQPTLGEHTDSVLRDLGIGAEAAIKIQE
jgi:formyl-CoA transferase